MSVWVSWGVESVYDEQLTVSYHILNTTKSNFTKKEIILRQYFISRMLRFIASRWVHTYICVRASINNRFQPVKQSCYLARKQ